MCFASLACMPCRGMAHTLENRSRINDEGRACSPVQHAGVLRDGPQLQIGHRTASRDRCGRCDCQSDGTSTPGARRGRCGCPALGASTSSSALAMEIASPQQDRDRSGRSAAQTILTPHPSQTATRQGTQRSIPTQSGRSEFVLDEEFWHSPPEPTAGHLVASSDDAPGRDADSSRGGAAINQMAPPRPDLPTPTGEPLALGPTILACVNSPSSTLLDPGNICR